MGAQQMLQKTEQCFKDDKFKSKPSSRVLIRTPPPKEKLTLRNPSFYGACRYSAWISVESPPPARQTYPQVDWLISFSSRKPVGPNSTSSSQHHRENQSSNVNQRTPNNNNNNNNVTISTRIKRGIWSSRPLYSFSDDCNTGVHDRFRYRRCTV